MAKNSLFPLEIFRKTDKILFQTEKLSRIGVLKYKFSSWKSRERKPHKHYITLIRNVRVKKTNGINLKTKMGKNNCFNFNSRIGNKRSIFLQQKDNSVY